MSQYTGVVAMLALAVLVVLAARLVHRLTTIEVRPAASRPFLSGHDPVEHALSRFHVRWYPTTLVFLAFDVEMLFMYPWAVVVTEVGSGAVIEMFVFLGVLLAGVAWAWREGALRWV